MSNFFTKKIYLSLYFLLLKILPAIFFLKIFNDVSFSYLYVQHSLLEVQFVILLYTHQFKIIHVLRKVEYKSFERRKWAKKRIHSAFSFGVTCKLRFIEVHVWKHDYKKK